MDNALWRELIEVNLFSAFYCSRAAARHMGAGGRVLFISSLAAENGGSDGQLGYATSKAGLFGMTRALAKELAPRAITVNALAPGIILGTPFHDRFTPPDARVAAIGRIPLGRAEFP